MQDRHDPTLGFLGGGAIAEVFVRRLLEGGFTRPSQVLVHDIDAARLHGLANTLGIRPMSSNRAVAEVSDIIFVAIPPVEVLPTLRDVAPVLRPTAVVVSLAAAVPLAMIEDAIRRPVAAVRVIPNINAWIGQGVNPFCWGRHVSPEQRSVVARLLAWFGEAVEIPEDQMPIATALTAVGPTYVLPLVDVLVEVAMAKGLPRDTAIVAVCRLLAGTAQLVVETHQRPAALSRLIGLHTLDEAAAGELFRAAVLEAFAKIRAAESKVAATAAAS